MSAPPCLAMGTYTVTNTSDSGANSLRQAITNVNAAAGTSYTIDYNITGGGTITLLSSLPDTNKSVSFENKSGATVTVSNSIASTAALTVGGSTTFVNTDPLVISTVLSSTSGNALGISSSAGTSLTIGSIPSAISVTAQAGTNAAYGIYSSRDLTISSGMAGNITAIAGTHTAVGILSSGTLNGGSAGSPVTISGTVSATANGLAVAVGSAGAMNLTVTGKISGIDSSGSGAGYAIRAGSPDGSGGWNTGSASNTVTLNTGAILVGKVDLGTGTNTLNLYGYGTTGTQFIGVTNLVAGDGVNQANWILNPDASSPSTFASLTINTYAALTINENVTISGNTLNNGSLTYDIGTTKYYGGIISGTGTVGKLGPGILYLTGNNTYSGGTFINGGTLNIASDSNLGDASGTVTFDGGTLQAGAALTTARSITVNPGGGALDNNGNPVTLTGTFTGSGPFTFKGQGVTYFSGNGSGYAGSATLTNGILLVNSSGSLGGSLTVNQGAALSGYGTLGNVINNGLVSPGGSIGTLSVSGNYTQGATAAFIEEIDVSGRSDLLKVSGSVALNGGLLMVSAPIAFYQTGTVWPAISAGNGLTGSFSGVASTFPSYILNFLPVYTSNATLILTTRIPYATFAPNSRAASAGFGLNKGAYTANGTFSAAILSMDLASPAGIASALNQLHPEPYDAYTQTGFDTGRLLTASVQSRLHALRTGEAQGAFSSLFDAAPSQTFAFSEAVHGASRTVESKDPQSRVSLFLQPFGMTARQGATGGRTPYVNNAWGVLGGVDFQPSHDIVTGAYVGYASRNLALGAPANDTGRAETTSLGIFASRFSRNWFVEGSARFGLDFYQTRRTVSVPAASFKASSNWSGWNFFANLGAGYEWHLGKWALGPVGSLDFARIAQNGWSESGADSIGLTIRPRADISMQTALGVRVARLVNSSWGRLTPEIRLLWGHEWANGSRDITAYYQGSENARFTTRTVPPSSDWLAMSAALTIQCSKRFSVGARLSTDLFRQEYQTLSGSLSLKYSF
ncbi:MAG: autotransporter domain-containing protein [Desulfovibrio sp.]|nr:autotransporter domain-containing protein [Desulfovibrio sp.]MBI4959266.1 autotransporter domain-containing protein [Desulfovibrio sp.]